MTNRSSAPAVPRSAFTGGHYACCGSPHAGGRALRPVRRTSSSSSPTTTGSGPPEPYGNDEVETPTLDSLGGIGSAHGQRDQPLAGVFSGEDQPHDRAHALTARGPRFPGRSDRILPTTGWTTRCCFPSSSSRQATGRR